MRKSQPQTSVYHEGLFSYWGHCTAPTYICRRTSREMQDDALVYLAYLAYLVHVAFFAHLAFLKNLMQFENLAQLENLTHLDENLVRISKI